MWGWHKRWVRQTAVQWRQQLAVPIVPEQQRQAAELQEQREVKPQAAAGQGLAVVEKPGVAAGQRMALEALPRMGEQHLRLPALLFRQGWPGITGVLHLVRPPGAQQRERLLEVVAQAAELQEQPEEEQVVLQRPERRAAVKVQVMQLRQWLTGGSM
jgi:hypothetical protein